MAPRSAPRSLSLDNLIAIAYRVKRYQISGPDWMASERFDIAAKLPAGAAEKEIPEMLQALLEDRFQMKMHRESRELPVYALVVGKGGPKMQESPADPAHRTKPVDRRRRQRGGQRPSQRRNASAMATAPISRSPTIAWRAAKCRPPRWRTVLAAFTDRPVVNMTDLRATTISSWSFRTRISAPC